MPEEDNLTFLWRATEEEYIQDFCEAYQEEIETPDGFVVFCKYLEQTAIHFCKGKAGVFQKARAQRILWAKYVLLNPDERHVLFDKKTKNILFFLTQKRKPYLVVCNRLEGKLNLISGHICGGKRAEQLLNGEGSYSFYREN